MLVCWEEHLSKAEILELLKISHRRFYMRPKFLARQVLGLSTGSELKRLGAGRAQPREARASWTQRVEPRQFDALRHTRGARFRLHTTPALADEEPAQWTGANAAGVEGAVVDARRAAEALQETAQNK